MTLPEATIARLLSIETAFKRAHQLDPTNSGHDHHELQADLARYLCILTAGYIETAITEICVEYSKSIGDGRLHNFVLAKTKRNTNFDHTKILGFLGSFESSWKVKMRTFLKDEYKDSVNSVYSLRNKVAHGDSVDITLARIQGHFNNVKVVIEKVSEIVWEEAN